MSTYTNPPGCPPVSTTWTGTLLCSIVFLFFVMFLSGMFSSTKDIGGLYNEAKKAREDLALSLSDNYELFSSHVQAQKRADDALEELKKKVGMIPEGKVPVEVKKFILTSSKVIHSQQ